MRMEKSVVASVLVEDNERRQSSVRHESAFVLFSTTAAIIVEIAPHVSGTELNKEINLDSKAKRLARTDESELP